MIEDCDLKKTIPLVVHGDDADSHRRRNFLILTVGSLMTGGAMFDTKFLVYCLDNSRATSETISTLDQWVVWSLTELAMGRWLDVDPYGRPHAPFDQGRCGLLADGWRAVVVVHKGDEKYIQKAYRTSHGAVSRNICIQCRATNEPGQLLYSHHGPNAVHRCTRLTTEEFIRDVCGVGNWVRLPGFHISFVQHDWLHVVDLTLVPECSASALVELVGQHVWSGGTSDERLRKAYVDFIKACKQAKIRSRGMVFSMLLGQELATLFVCWGFV